jgi:hypothetical protein
MTYSHVDLISVIMTALGYVKKMAPAELGCGEYELWSKDELHLPDMCAAEICHDLDELVGILRRESRDKISIRLDDPDGETVWCSIASSSGLGKVMASGGSVREAVLQATVRALILDKVGDGSVSDYLAAVNKK